MQCKSRPALHGVEGAYLQVAVGDAVVVALGSYLEYLPYERRCIGLCGIGTSGD